MNRFESDLDRSVENVPKVVQSKWHFIYYLKILKDSEQINCTLTSDETVRDGPKRPSMILRLCLE